MNKQLIPVLVAMATLSCLVGCGIAVIDENPGTMQNDGMKTGTTTATGSTSDTQTSATTSETPTETGTATEPPIEPELIVTQLEPVDGPSGAAMENLMAIALYAPNHSVQVSALPFTLGSTDGSGFVKGSVGTEYFWNILLTDASSTTVAGPLDLSETQNGSKNADIVFAGSFVVGKGDTVTLTFVSALTISEDSPGEFVGNDYLLVLHTKEIKGWVADKPLDPEAVTPKEDLARQFQIDIFGQ